MYLCYKFSSREHIDAKHLEFGNGSVVVPQSIKQSGSVGPLLGLGQFEDVFLANWVKVWGTVYRPGMLLVMKVDSEGNPCFGKVLHNVVIEGSAIIIAQAWHTLFFDRHLFSYCVRMSEPSLLQTLRSCEMVDHHPYHRKWFIHG